MKKNNDVTPLQRGIIITLIMGILTMLLITPFALVIIGLPLLDGGPLYLGKEIILGLLFFFAIEIITIWLVAWGARDIGPLVEKWSAPYDYLGFPTLVTNGGNIQGVIAALIVHGALYEINSITEIWHPAFIGSFIAIIGSASIGLIVGSIHEWFDYFGWYDRILEKVPLDAHSFRVPKTHK